MTEIGLSNAPAPRPVEVVLPPAEPGSWECQVSPSDRVELSEDGSDVLVDVRYGSASYSTFLSPDDAEACGLRLVALARSLREGR